MELELRQRLVPERASALSDEKRRQVIIISCCPEEYLTLTHARRPLITLRSYINRKSAVVVEATASAVAAAMAVAADGVGGKLNACSVS